MSNYPYQYKQFNDTFLYNNEINKWKLIMKIWNTYPRKKN